MMWLYFPDWLVVPVILPLFAALLVFVAGRRSAPWLMALMALGLGISFVALSLQLQLNGKHIHFAGKDDPGTLGIVKPKRLVSTHIDQLALFAQQPQWNVSRCVVVIDRRGSSHQYKNSKSDEDSALSRATSSSISRA